MGYYLGNKIPEYNPWWEEKEYQDMPDWYKWYHLGHDEGYAKGTNYNQRTEHDFEFLQRKVESLEALITADERCNTSKEHTQEES